ncbi:helix-turn-helix domain-containing protein [uncultured Methanoregula sp.]|uniref:ArsR/SmtB family transcription factor n=1 Tax=uncultured Methanoregula sp. TaxID=1005933 RepID=UPI002AABEFDB|nr:helix-turn-helix domain-containing protein [uncultured Methanoregula sp.]
MADDVVLLEPGDQRAQKIAKAMASQTGGDILHLLGDGPKSLTDIADHLKLPMNTAKYHLENLLDAGLISVAETKYSVKGREVKIYSLTNQLLIVAPRHSNVRSLLLKYASLFGIVVVATLGLAFLAPFLGGPVGMTATAPMPMQADREMNVMAAKAAYGGEALSGSPSPDFAIAFFLGGLLVILVLLGYEAYLWKKR